jgi:hypothetical protein
MENVDVFIVICISRLRNLCLTHREKNCRRGRLRPRHHNLEDVSDIKMTFAVYFNSCRYGQRPRNCISRRVLGTRNARFAAEKINCLCQASVIGNNDYSVVME